MSVGERVSPVRPGAQRSPSPAAAGPAPVVAGTDGSGPAVLAVAWAAEEAVLRGTTLRLFTVVDAGHRVPDPQAVLERARVVATLHDPEPVVEASVESGDPAAVLAEHARSAQLTVVGHRGAGGRPSVALGSAAFRLTRSCASPLVVVRFAPGRPVPDRSRPIVVGLDGSASDAVVLDHAAATAAARGAALQVVHVWTEHLTGAARRLGHRERRSGREGAEQVLADATAGLTERFPGLAHTSCVVRGRPAWSLLELSDSAQLMIVGVRRGPAPGLCPSVLVQASGCPVAVVPVPRSPAAGLAIDDLGIRR